MSKTKSLHHFVFATKYRECTLVQAHIDDLCSYVAGIFQKRKCFVHKVNGFRNHIHMVVDMHPTISMSELMKDVKISSHNWLRMNSNFPMYNCWGEGYYACSLSPSHLPAAIAYVANQVHHHSAVNFDEEMDRLMVRLGLDYHQDDFR